MRSASALCILCVAAAPTFGDPVTYSFDVISGSLTMDVSPDGIASPDPATVAMGGTFGVTIYQSNGHIGESDTFLLEDCGLYNTEAAEICLMGMVTAYLDPGSAQFLDFAPDGPGHIGPGGTAHADTDVFLDMYLYVPGVSMGWYETETWAGELLPFDLTFTTSVGGSDVLIVTLGGTWAFEIGVGDITQTITLDLIVDVVGTAHVVPDPALGGLSALGLIGAGAWLRRRRP